MIPELFAGLGVGFLKRFVTERFLVRVVIRLLKALAESTKNRIDDDIVKEIAMRAGEQDLETAK